MKRLNRIQKIIFLCSIIFICIIGMAFEIDYYGNQKEVKIFTYVDQNTNDISTIEHEDVDMSGINVATKNLQVKIVENPTILFGSDYQGDNRYDNTNRLFQTVKDQIDPNLMVFCGDYQVDKAEKYYNTENGIVELNGIINNYFEQSIPKIFVQGNHDSLKARGLAENGIYESDNYIVYVINRDSFPNNQDEEEYSEEIVKQTSEVLKKDLQFLVDTGNKKPVFVATHVPLHYTTRNGGLDNAYAHYIVEVLNEYGNKLDIVYLFGHNHSDSFDDYIGGSINYISIGSSMNIGGTNQLVNINFTYLNAGYIGYANNSVTDHSVKETSMSAITINNENLSIQKYTKYGQYYKVPLVVELKNK